MNETPAFLKPTSDGVLIAVKAQPRANRNEIAGVHGDELKIRVAAPPVDSAANTELVKFLAKRLGVPKSAVTIARGETSRHKHILVRNVDIRHVLERLGRANGI